MSFEVAIVVLAAGILGAGSFAIGFWIGRVGSPLVDAAGTSETSQPSWVERERRLVDAIEQCAKASQRLASGVRSLQLSLGEQEIETPPAIVEQVEQLVMIASLLASRLDAAFRIPEHAAVINQIATHASDSSAIDQGERGAAGLDSEPVSDGKQAANLWLTAAEFANLSQVEHLSQDDAAMWGQNAQHRYECDQFIAPWEEGSPLPLASEFTRVRCRSISRDSISFVLSKPPNFETVLITIGLKEHSMIMCARVVNSHCAFLYGELSYLVTCKFVKRIGSTTRCGTVPASARAGELSCAR